jgi:DnaK suppressor protein
MSSYAIQGKERKHMREQVDYLKAALQNKRLELERVIRSQSTQLIVSEVEHDLLDRTQSIYKREETVTFLNILTRTLADVDAALMAMNEGSYGTCVECGEPIASRRLQAIPWTSHCIRCQQAHDQSEQLRMAAMGWSEAA